MSKFEYLNKCKVKIINNKKYLYKKKSSGIEEIFSYLKTRNYENYIAPIEINNEYEIYPFIETNDIKSENKTTDLIYLISILHSKTTTFEDINIDEAKKIYEDTINRLNEIKVYYLKMQDEIEEVIYMSPAEQQLMNNISKIYKLLDLSRYFIEKYYERVSARNNIRKAFIHNNLRLDHLIENDNHYLISWRYAKKDLPVYDLVNLYKNEFRKIELIATLNIYYQRYKLYDYEEYLLFSLICIPWKERITYHNLEDCLNMDYLVDYINKTLDVSLEKYKEDESKK